MLSKFKTLIKKPGHLFRYRSLVERKIYFFLSKYLHTNTYLKRKTTQDLDLMNFKNGFLKLNPEDLYSLGVNVSEIISEIEDLIIKKKINYKEQIKNTGYEKPIIEILTSKDFNNQSKTFKLVTNNKLIKIISNYLGFIPLLTHITLWFSPNKKNVSNSSQEFHLDHEDIKQVKGFFLVEDITEDNGPTIFLNSSDSKIVLNKVKYRTNESSKRLDESVINKHHKNNRIICTGKKGTLYLIDTSNCFHCGSREANKSRKILAFQFITTFSTSLRWNWKKSEILNKPFWLNNDLSEEQKKIIGMI